MESWNELFEKYRAVFVVTANERIAEIADLLDRLERNDAPEDAVNQLSHRFHQMSGSAGSYGFDGVSRACSEAETLCQTVLERDRLLEPSEIVRCREIVERLLAEISHDPS